MDLIATLILLVIVCVILDIKPSDFKKHLVEGFKQKPNEKKAQEYIDDVFNNKELFQRNYRRIKEKLYWIDPVLYWDIKEMINKNVFNKKNIRKALMK